MIHPFGRFEQGSRVRQNELTAMRALATALEDLGDNQARARVIRWAIETFGITITGAVAAQPEAFSLQTADAMDPTLTVDGVDEFFDQVRGREPLRDAEPWPPPMRAPLSASKLQRDELEAWLPVTPTVKDELEAWLPVTLTVKDELEAAWLPVTPTVKDEFEAWLPVTPTVKSDPVKSDQGVVSLLHGFVADFQQLARDLSDKPETGNRIE